jgi:hypothetical protein
MIRLLGEGCDLLATIPHRILTARRGVLVVAMGLLLALGWAVPSASAKLPGLTVEVVSSGCRDGQPYLEYLVTNKSSTYYVLAAVGFVASNGETAEVTTGAGGYFILQGQSTATFAPAFPEMYEGQTVTPYVHLYPYYKREFVYGAPTTVPTCPGSPPTTAPPGTATTIPGTTIPETTVPETTVPETTTTVPASTVAPTTAAPTSVTVP